MTLHLTIPKAMHTDFTPRITVVGVGGGGTNAVDNMIALDLKGVEFVVANTDAQQLMHSRSDKRIQLGPHLTQGLGAGAKPDIGRAAAEEAADELVRHLDGVHMVFITAGMGGGTGTGAAPVIARMARERGILTVGVVTKPFSFEGARRARAADAGITELQQFVDTLIVIPNQNLFRLANERTGWKEAFKMADHVLYMGVRGVTDLMVAPGLVNLDFADIRTVMAEMGKAMMGTGEAEGENRAIRAAEAAISNPLLEDTNMQGAQGLLINITGGDDMTLYEVDQAANRIREEVADDANIIFGSAIDENLSGRIRVSVVATGIESPIRHEAERPRLVAVGGGVAQAMPAAMGSPVVNLSPAQAPGMQPQGLMASPALSPAMGSPSLGLAPAAAMLVEAAPVVPSMPPVHTRPTMVDRVLAAVPLSPAMAPFDEAPAMIPPSGPRFAPASRSTAPAPASPPRSLFGLVTGTFRRGAIPNGHPAAAEPARAEPVLDPREPQATVRPSAAEEVGLEIPAFLRRQS